MFRTIFEMACLGRVPGPMARNVPLFPTFNVRDFFALTGSRVMLVLTRAVFLSMTAKFCVWQELRLIRD